MKKSTIAIAVIVVLGLSYWGYTSYVAPNTAPTPTPVFKAEEFSHPHIDQVLSSININDTFSDLSARFSMVPNKRWGAIIPPNYGVRIRR